MVRVSVEAVSKRYGHVEALRDVSLDFAAGKLTAILGPSGCGKTTLLRSIAGFVSVDAGAIRFDGDDVTGLPPQQRGTAMVFQSYALWPHMTVFDNVAYGLRLKRVPAEAVRAACAPRSRSSRSATWTTWRGASPARCPAASSSAWRWRARSSSSRACSCSTSRSRNLDAKVRQRLRVEVRRLQRRVGITTIYVTHDQEEALAIADRVVLMNARRVVQAGTPEDVYLDPASEFAADFLGRGQPPRGARRGRRARSSPASACAYDGPARGPVRGRAALVRSRPGAGRAGGRRAGRARSRRASSSARYYRHYVRVGDAVLMVDGPDAGAAPGPVTRLRPAGRALRVYPAAVIRKESPPCCCALVAPALLALVVPASAATRLNVAIGADVNVVEVHKTLLGPGFRASAPDVELNVVGTGTGEPASRAIYTKIKAQADTGRKPWDIDVALVSMAVASQMVKEGLLHRYVPQMKNAALVKGAEVKEAFGVTVDGYVVPMFHNQIAIAYNPAKVATPPKSFDELAAWVEGQPRQLRLQRHQGRRERRRLHHGLGVLEDRALQGAHPGALRQGQGAGRSARPSPRSATSTSRRSSPTATRARWTRSTAARSGWARLDRPARGLEERGPHGPVDHARAARARPADLSALPRGAAGGRQPRGGRALHRLHRHARGAGQGHRRALRLVPGRGRRTRCCR